MAQCGVNRNAAFPAIRNLSNPIESEFNRCWPAPPPPSCLCQALEQCLKEKGKCGCDRPRPHSAPPACPSPSNKYCAEEEPTGQCGGRGREHHKPKNCSTKSWRDRCRRPGDIDPCHSRTPLPSTCNEIARRCDPNPQCGTSGGRHHHHHHQHQKSSPSKCNEMVQTTCDRTVECGTSSGRTNNRKCQTSSRKEWLAQCQRPGGTDPFSSSCSHSEESGEDDGMPPGPSSLAPLPAPSSLDLKLSGSENLRGTPEKTKIEIKTGKSSPGKHESTPFDLTIKISSILTIEMDEPPASPKVAKPSGIPKPVKPHGSAKPVTPHPEADNPETPPPAAKPEKHPKSAKPRPSHTPRPSATSRPSTTSRPSDTPRPSATPRLSTSPEKHPQVAKPEKHPPIDKPEEHPPPPPEPAKPRSSVRHVKLPRPVKSDSAISEPPHKPGESVPAHLEPEIHEAPSPASLESQHVSPVPSAGSPEPPILESLEPAPGLEPEAVVLEPEASGIPGMAEYPGVAVLESGETSVNVDPLPAGALPAGSLPAGSFPAGTLPAGSFPPGSLPAGSFPPGSLPAGSFPAGSFPAGPLPVEHLIRVRLEFGTAEDCEDQPGSGDECVSTCPGKPKMVDATCSPAPKKGKKSVSPKPKVPCRRPSRDGCCHQECKDLRAAAPANECGVFTQMTNNGRRLGELMGELKCMKDDVNLCRVIKSLPVHPNFKPSLVCEKLCNGTLDPNKNRIHQFLSVFPNTASKQARFCEHLRDQQRRAQQCSMTQQCTQTGFQQVNDQGCNCCAGCQQRSQGQNPAMKPMGNDPSPGLFPGEPVPPAKDQPRKGPRIPGQQDPPKKGKAGKQGQGGAKDENLRKNPPLTSLPFVGAVPGFPGQPPPKESKKSKGADSKKNQKGNYMGLPPVLDNPPSPAIPFQQQQAFQPPGYSPYHHHPMTQTYDQHKYAFKWGGTNTCPAQCLPPPEVFIPKRTDPLVIKRTLKDVTSEIKEVQMIEQAKLLEKAVKECEAARKTRWWCPKNPREYQKIICPADPKLPKLKMEDFCPPVCGRPCPPR